MAQYLHWTNKQAARGYRSNLQGNIDDIEEALINAPQAILRYNIQNKNIKLSSLEIIYWYDPAVKFRDLWHIARRTMNTDVSIMLVLLKSRRISTSCISICKRRLPKLLGRFGFNLSCHKSLKHYEESKAPVLLRNPKLMYSERTFMLFIVT